jgi:hypothetical protein
MGPSNPRQKAALMQIALMRCEHGQLIQRAAWPDQSPRRLARLLHQKISGVLEHSYRERFAQHSFLSGRVENRSDAQPDKLW